MHKKTYRIEKTKSETSPTHYYLVKDVTFKGKHRKIRLKLGTSLPLPDEIEKLSETHSFELELQAALKKAEMSCIYYVLSFLTEAEIKEIEEIKHISQAFESFLADNEIEAYEARAEIKYIQGTSAIEGNTITFQEASDLLTYGIVPTHRKLREINEIQNFIKVKKFRDDHSGKVTLSFIKELHSLIMDNIDFETAGQFRRIDDVYIYGTDFRVTPSPMIEFELQELIDQYYKNLSEKAHPFEEALRFHCNFEMIHPFTDGNGRVGREILNYMLRKNGYLRLIVTEETRAEYLKALRAGNDKKYGDMTRIFRKLIFEEGKEDLIEKLKKVIGRRTK